MYSLPEDYCISSLWALYGRGLGLAAGMESFSVHKDLSNYSDNIPTAQVFAMPILNSLLIG